MPGTSRFNGARPLPSLSHAGGHLHPEDRFAAMSRGSAHAGSSLAAHLHVRLPVETESVSAAHHCIFGIAPALDPETLDDVRLLISELVTNAIRHAGLTPEDWIELVVDVGSDQVRVEVRDPGPGFDPARLPVPKRARHCAELHMEDLGGPYRGGWGLEFLRRIASRWGVERNGLTSVWFEVDLQPPTGGGPGRGRG